MNRAAKRDSTPLRRIAGYRAPPSPRLARYVISFLNRYNTQWRIVYEYNNMKNWSLIQENKSKYLNKCIHQIVYYSVYPDSVVSKRLYLLLPGNLLILFHSSIASFRDFPLFIGSSKKSLINWLYSN